MPRRGNVPKREILPDPMYNSVLVTKLDRSKSYDGIIRKVGRVWLETPDFDL